MAQEGIDRLVEEILPESEASGERAAAGESASYDD
jgi:hypothetical protein